MKPPPPPPSPPTWRRPSSGGVGGAHVLMTPPPRLASPERRAGHSPRGVTTYHPPGVREPGLEPIRRVAGRYMADVAKNGARRPGTPDRSTGCGTLDRNRRGIHS